MSDQIGGRKWGGRNGSDEGEKTRNGRYIKVYPTEIKVGRKMFIVKAINKKNKTILTTTNKVVKVDELSNPYKENLERFLDFLQ